MQKVITMISELSHTTKNGQKFRLCLKKKHLSEQHNYWLYFIEVEHESWRKQGFGIFVTKQAYPSEEVADHLACTLAIEEVKVMFEETTQEGRPLYLPVVHEGWAIA